MDPTQISWDLLDNPEQLAAVLVLVMTLLIKPALDLGIGWFGAWLTARGSPPDPVRWDGLRGVVVNLVTAAGAAGLAYWRLGRADGYWFVLTIVATSLAVAGYEGLKNILAMLAKVEIKQLNLFAKRE